MNEANRNLVVRIISALVLAPPLILCILWRRPEGIAGVVLLASAVALGEFYWIALREDPVWMRLVGIALGVALSATIFWVAHPGALLIAMIVVALLPAIMHLFRFGEIERATANTSVMVFGILYVPLLLTTLALLKRRPDGSEWIILILTITWFSDTGAYAVGRAVGRRKLYPAISPGKSVEGAVGGLVAAFGAAALAKLWYLPGLSWLDAALVSIPGSALGQIGDLVESMIKRGYGVKDSGRAIPGHGGLLDRIDALLFVCPYVYLYATYLFGRLS